MDFNKALQMFEELNDEMEEIMKEDSCNIMVEKATQLGYDYAKSEKDSKLGDGK